MRSSWIREIFKYAVLLLPTVLLAGLAAHFVVGFWIAAILADPTRFANAPHIVQQLTRSVYANTRTHWQIQRECIDFDSEVLYRPKPGTCRFRNAEFDTLMHFDSRGFRQTSPMANGSEPRARMIIVGDSHAMGWGVEDHETFASRLAELHGFEVLNLGVSSYGTVRELKRLERSAELRPNDIVVIQYSDNDLDENVAYLTGTGVGPYEERDLDPLVLYRPTPSEPGPIAGQILRRTQSVILGRLQRLLTLPSNHAASAADPEHAAKTLLGVIQRFPFVHSNRIVVVAINGFGSRTHLEGGRSLLESAGLTLLTPALSPEQFFQIDDHMTAAGHTAVAASLADTSSRLETSSGPIRPTAPN